MKKSYTFLSLTLIWSFNFYSQTKEKAIEIIKPQTICVNSITSLNGSTRKVIPIHLPPNTVKWYYSYSAFRNKQDLERVSSNFNLLSKLSYLVDQSGTTSSALTILGKPPGNDYCDVFLLNSPNEVKSFEEKSSFQYNRQGSREGLVSGVIDIDDNSKLNDWQYIGLRNNDINNAVNVLLQVVAIVSVVQTSNGWSASRKQQTYLNIKNLIMKNQNAQLNQNIIEDLTACLMNKITKDYTPDQLSLMAEYEFKPIITKMGEDCLKEQNFVQR